MKLTGVGRHICAARAVPRVLVLLLTFGVLLPLGVLSPGDGSHACAAETGKEPDSAAWKERLKEIAISIKAHKKAFDLPALEDDLERLETLYEDARADDKLCGQLIKLVGSMTRGTKDAPLATAMLRTLAAIGDPRGARYVKPYLRQGDKKQSSDLLAVAVDVAEDVRHASLVKPLLTIVLKSKTYGIAGKCVGTLGYYRDVKRTRSTIVETLLKTLKKSKPGGRPRMRGGSTSMDGNGGSTGSSGSGQGGGTQARWGVLRTAVPRALQNLTGQEFGGTDDWIAVLKQYKGKYGQLFTEDE